MNTPTIAAALANPPAQSGQAASNTGEAGSGASFSHVLGGQHAALEQKGQTPSQTPSANGKPAQPAKSNTETQEPHTDAELAVLAGEQGLSLPQIALSLAAHALAGTSQDPAGQAEPPVDTTPTMPGGKADLTTLLAHKAATRGDAPAQAGVHAPSAEATRADSLNLAGTEKQLPVTDTQATAPTAMPDTRSVATQLRARAAEAQPVQKRTDPSVSTATPTLDQQAVNAQTNAPAQQPDHARPLSAAAAPFFDPAALAPTNMPLHGANPATSAASSLSIATPLPSPQWPSDFGRQFVALSQNAGNQPQTAELRLDPPELGPIRITININDNVAHAVFVSAHASVRNAIENALPQLQQQLAQAGISLGQTNVSDQSQQQSAFGQPSQPGQHAARGTEGGTTATSLDQIATHSGARIVQNSNSLVDTFA